MTRTCCRVLHVSDIHFTSGDRAPVRDQLRRIARRLHPDWLIVTGDLVDHPLPWQMRRAAEFVSELEEDCGIEESKHVVVVAGNHDYKYFGNFGLARLTRIPFHVYFRRNGLRMSRGRRLGEYARLLFDALSPRGSSLRDECFLTHDRENGIVVVGFDSTPLFEWGATGAVKSERIGEAKDRLRECGGDDTPRYRIAAVHHHPLPIPYSPIGAKARAQESFLIFHNAGTFLREMGLGGVDLVLHGHKHRTGFSRIRFDFPESAVPVEIGVIAAASATHGEDGPNSLEVNVLEIHDDDTVELEQRFFSPETDELPRSRRITVFDIDAVRAKRNRAARDKYRLSMQAVERVARLTPNGYTDVEETFRGCQALDQGGLDHLAFPLEVSPPTYVRDLVVSENPGFHRLIEKEVDRRNYEVTIDLGTNHSPSRLFDCGFAFRLMNGHALSRVEFDRRYGNQKLDCEYATTTTMWGADRLSLTVLFPDGYDMSQVDACGADALYQPCGSDDHAQHMKETSRIQGGFRRLDTGFELHVSGPIPDFDYRIRWTYRRVQSPTTFDRALEARFAIARKRLIRAVETEGRSLVVDKLLELFRAALEKRYDAIDPDEDLQITLAIHDDRRSSLTMVGATDDGESRIRGLSFCPGEGCAGFAFEKRRVSFFDLKEDDLGIYLSSRELTGSGSSTPHEFLVAVPWIDEAGVTRGVVSVGSRSEGSRLSRLFAGSDILETENQYLLGLTRLVCEAVIAAELNIDRDADDKGAGIEDTE